MNVILAHPQHEVQERDHQIRIEADKARLRHEEPQDKPPERTADDDAQRIRPDLLWIVLIGFGCVGLMAAVATVHLYSAAEEDEVN